MKDKIPIFEPPPVTVNEPAFWRARAVDGPELRSRQVPCSDCAIVTGFYTEIAERLRQQPDPVRVACSKRWFCHTTRDRSCKGNWDFQFPKGAKDAKSATQPDQQT